MIRSRAFAAAVLVLVSGCATVVDGAVSDALPAGQTTTTGTMAPTPKTTTTWVVGTTTSAAPQTTTTTTSSTTSSTSRPSARPSTSSTSVETSTTLDPARPVSYAFLGAASAALVDGNRAVSVSVWRNGRSDFSFASGERRDGRTVDSNTPFVIASVSKLVTAMTIARLVDDDRLELLEPVPWDAMDVVHDPAWDDVTVRQLLAHTSGMPVARKTWLDEPGSCIYALQQAMALPPTDGAGTWVYSNGNYCALGLLVEHVTGLNLDEAAHQLVFGPAGVSGPYVSTDGADDASAPYTLGLARLDRLGGAGVWLASTDDIAAMLASVTPDDRRTLEWPGIIVDQYGWGHTGSLDGAEACAWVLEEGATVITAFVSGSKPNTGGKVCDRVVPALAADLGIWAGDSMRNPV